jgi:hypothetical protein
VRYNTGMVSPTNDAVRAQVQLIRELIGDLAQMTHSPGSDVMVVEIESQLADRPPRPLDR